MESYISGICFTLFKISKLTGIALIPLGFYDDEKEDNLMKDIQAFLQNKGAVIQSDEEDNTLLEEENGIIMEDAPQQILFNGNGNGCQSPIDNWSSECENEQEGQPRKKSANSRKNVHFR